METQQNNVPQTLTSFYAHAWEDLLSNCTRCGKCVEVCPVVPFDATLAAAQPVDVVTGVLDFMKDSSQPMREDSALWTYQCNGCDECIPACPVDINPRRMLMLANAEVSAKTHPTPHMFQKMARAIRILVSMQLVPEDAARLLKLKKPKDVDVVFFTGCNPVRTPQLLFNAMSVLEALGVNYEVMGGPASCCGVIHSKWEGDLQRGGKVSEQTLHRFGTFNPKTVLNWCPSCSIHLTETIKDYRSVSFDFDHITKFLIEREDELHKLFTTPVNMRVVVHTHHGMHDVGQNVMRLMRAIPGLTIVDEIEEPGYMCGVSSAERAPALKEQVRAQTIARCKQDDVDALVSLYHACHRQLASDGKTHGFQVLNYADLLVRALGMEPYADTLEQFRGRTDYREMVREAAPLLEANGIDMDPDELARVLPEIFAMAEWRGGLCSFSPEE
ncbi:(Fe-S)-binding protein [Ottowia thiooxydans]|uniref:Heterodisulfide reductase subunit D n=1 Tax=Ottowia thiooxydans TaxID=219182 RepID=A0ABV2QF16_9BURK